MEAVQGEPVVHTCLPDAHKVDLVLKLGTLNFG